ncbi:MAG: hypothetical protein IJ829_00300 [Kiritimatiellae bacterium]|nr:hypothetical protein [Kiritimatiellia bacterium]
MSQNSAYDRWYAACKVRILLSPAHRLETFGNTLVNYHMVSELEDRPGKIRIREGRLEAHQPLVIAPHFSEITTEGFGDEARAYVEWLKANEESMRILRYGYCLKTDNFSEQIVTDSLAAVSERVKAAVASAHDDFAAVLQGVDEPWDVALVELWRREVTRSAPKNIRELGESGKLF